MFVGDESSGHGFGVRASVSQVSSQSIASVRRAAVDALPTDQLQLKFNPARPNLLYASFRREDSIYCWDIRGNPASPIQRYDLAAYPSRLLASSMSESMPRGADKVVTNQRLQFDIDLGGRWLSVGDQVHRSFLSPSTHDSWFQGGQHLPI